MRETVDDHDSFVMWMVDTRNFDDEVWLRWYADMMCSVGQSRPMRRELGLLFYDAALAFGFGGFPCTGGCDLARLHEFADV